MLRSELEITGELSKLTFIFPKPNEKTHIAVDRIAPCPLRVHAGPECYRHT